MFFDALRQLPCVAPHQLVPWLHEQGLAPQTGSAKRYWSKLETPHPAKALESEPLFLYGDSAQFTKYGDHLLGAFMGFVMSEHNGLAYSRFPLFFLLDRFSAGRSTEQPLWRFVVESLQKLVRMPGSHMVTELRGDWKFFADCLALKATPTSKEVMLQVQVHPGIWPDELRHIWPFLLPGCEAGGAVWTFFANVLPEVESPQRSPLIWLPGFSMHILKPCWMHTAHLGVGLFTNGSAMKVLLDREVCGAGLSKDQALRALFLRFKGWQKQLGVRVAMPRFRHFLLKTNLEQNFYQSKAHHSRILTSFLAAVLAEESKKTPADLELVRASLCLYVLSELCNRVEQGSRFLTQEASLSNLDMCIYIYIYTNKYELLYII